MHAWICVVGGWCSVVVYVMSQELQFHNEMRINNIIKVPEFNFDTELNVIVDKIQLLRIRLPIKKCTAILIIFVYHIAK